MKISIIGAGISGLTAAFRLSSLNNQHNAGLQIEIFEKSGRAGGNISTKSENGIIVEEGADSFITSKPWGVELCRELGIEELLISTNDTNRKTYIYFENRLNELPEGFFMMAPSNLEAFGKSPFFSEEGKKQILGEMEVPPVNEKEDESLESFVLRRFGRELLEKVAQPLIGGIYTGDPSRLSMKAILPEFSEMEHKQGSVIKGVIEKYSSSEISKKDSGARYGLFVSFKQGLSVLTDTLLRAIPEVKINLNSNVKEISNTNGKWLINTDKGDLSEADAVIISGPAYISSHLIKSTDEVLSNLLGRIEYESSVVVNLVYEKKYCAGLPEGFGVVIPRTENMGLIACSFTAHKFNGRAPADKEIIRCFLGGAFNRGIIDLNDKEIMEILQKEMKILFNIESPPVKSYIYHYPGSMPQYTVGYMDLMDNIKRELQKHNSLALSGNAYGGVGIPDTIKSGIDAAEKIFHNLVKPEV